MLGFLFGSNLLEQQRLRYLVLVAIFPYNQEKTALASGSVKNTPPHSSAHTPMADTSATIRLKAIDQNVASTLGNIGSVAQNLSLGFTAVQFGFGALEKASRSAVGQFALGIDTSERLAGVLGKVSSAGSTTVSVLGKLGDALFIGQQLATAGQGLATAAEQWTRIPQALASFQASGVSTKPIEDFNTLTEAVKGSGASIDSFVTSAIAQLSEFEAASQRIGTILRSSTRFDNSGEALRSNRAEQLKNAFEVQKLVNTELDNTVTSTEALSSQYDVLSSGFTKAADSQKVLAAGLKLVGIGEAGGQSAPVSATTRLLTTTMNAYELSAEQAAETAGVINGIVEAGITTIPEMLDLGATAKQASAAGISLKDLASGVSVLTVQGVNSAESLTGLSSVAANIIDKTPEAQEALDKLTLGGQKIRFDKAEIQSKGLVQALIDLNKAAGGSASTLSQIFPDQVTFRTVLALLAQSGEKLKSIRADFEGAGAQSLDEVFKIASEDRIPRMEKIANRFQEAVIGVAASLAPVIEPGLAALEGIGNFFNSLPDSVKRGIGAWIAAQVQFKAGGMALAAILDTLKTLATNYLIARGTSLLLTGQLGKEIAVLRELFTQRKGLLAVGLQIFGIDQRWRLVSEQATDAIQKQSVAARVLTGARQKLAEVVGKNVQGFQQANLTPQAAQQLQQTGAAVAAQATAAVTAGATTATNAQARQAAVNSAEELWKATKEQAAKAIQGVTKSAQTIGTGLGQAAGVIPTPQILGPDGKPISQGGIQSVQAELQRIGKAAGDAAQNTFQGLTNQFGQPLPIPQIDPADAAQSAQNAAQAAKQQIDQVRQTVVGQTNQVMAQALRDQEAMTLDARTLQTTSELTQRDTEVKKQSAKASEERAKWLNLQADAQNKAAQVDEIAQRIEKKSLELDEQRAQATRLFLDDTVSRDEKQKALNETLKQEQALERESTRLQAAEIEAESLTNQVTEAKAKAIESSTASLQTRLAAEQRLEPVARAMAEADVASTAATQARQAASIAASEALQIEAVLGEKDQQTISARSKAKALEAEATQLGTVATQKATAANILYRTEARASELAEKGLAETRFFGRSIVYSTEGPLGGLNKLLATEITLKGAAAAATNAYNLAQGGASRTIESIGKVLSGDLSGFAKVGSSTKDFFKAIGSGAQGAFGLAKGGISALLQPLGLFGPLAIAGGIAAIAFRDDIGGLGGAAREASKGFDEFQKKQTELERQLQGSEGLSKLREQTKALINDTTYVGESTKRATQAGETIQRGFVESALSLPGDAFTGISKGVGDLFGGVGKTATDAANQELTKVAVPAAEKLKPFRTELDQLRSSGAITNGQFALLSKSLNDVGTSGQVNKEKLKEFKSQLDAVMQGASGVAEEGIMDKIWGGVKGIPGGILDQFDNIVNIPAAAVGKARKVLTGEQDVGSALGDTLTGKAFEESKGQREADRLVRPISEIGIALEKVGNASVSTQEAVGRYNKGLALTADVSEKISKGVRLSATDLEGENEAFKNRQKLNEGIIGGLNDQIKKYEEIASKIKDPEQKAVFQGRIDSLRQEISGLEKRNQKLKEGNEFLNKYQTETLPNLIQALNESTDPTKALKTAGETFRQQYQTDAKGKVTPFIKDIATLRQESQRYQAQILENLSTGEFDVGGATGEAEAASKLQEVRDSQIKYVEDGVEKAGYRLATADRRALTENIAKLQNESLKNQEDAGNLQSERIKALQQSQVLGSAEAEKQIGEIQSKNLQLRLEQKENEITEFQKAGLRTVELEQQASELRVQIDANETSRRQKIREQGLQERLKLIDIESERTKAQQIRRTITQEEAEEKLTANSIKQAQERINTLKEQQQQATADNPEFLDKIQNARNQVEETSSVSVDVDAAKGKLSELQAEGEKLGKQLLDLPINEDSTGIQLKIKENKNQVKLAQEEITKTRTNATRSRAAQEQLDSLLNEQKERAKGNPELTRQIQEAEAQLDQQQGQQEETRRQRRIKRREADFQLEQDRLKVSAAARTSTQDEVEKQSSQIEIKAAQARLADLEELYKRSGSKDVDVARDIAKQRLEIERLNVDAIEKERQRLIRNRDGELEVQKAQLQAQVSNRLVTQEEAERKQTQIEQEAAQNRIKDTEELYNKSGQRDVGLRQNLAKARAEAERLSGEAIEKDRQRQISRRNAGFEIEEAQVRLSLSNRLVSQRDAERQSDEIQLSSAQARLSDLEELYKKSGSRDIDLANDISKARIEIEQKTAEAINKEREFQFAQDQARIKNETQTEILFRQQTLNQGQIQQKDLELRNRQFDDAKSLLNSQNQAVESQLQNQSKLTADSVSRAGIERIIAENRLANLDKQQQFERQSIANQRVIVGITSDREVAQARLQQLENQRDLQLTRNELEKARQERKPGEEIRTIELQLQGLEQQNSLLDQQVGQAERSRNQQLESLDNQRRQLDLTQASARENAQIEAAQARINEYGATLAQATERVSLAEQTRQQQLQQSQKFNESIGRGLEQQLGYLEAQAKAVNARTEFATSELSLAADLTKSDTERRDINRTIADIKLRSTQQQIEYEKVVLELNQQQKQLQLESEKITNRSNQSRNIAEQAKAQAELAKMQASPTATREEISAARLNLRATEQEGRSLQFQEFMLGQQQQLNVYQQQQERIAAQYQGQSRIDQAKAERIKALPENQQAAEAAALKNEVLARGRAAGFGSFALPDVGAIRRNAAAIAAEFQVPSMEMPVELQPKRSQAFIDDQLRQLEPVRAEFEEMRRSFSPTTAAENLSRRVNQLQQNYTQQQTPQATVELKGRPIIEKVVIENVSTNIENSQTTPGQDIEGVVFRTISNLTDRLQREFS